MKKTKKYVGANALMDFFSVAKKLYKNLAMDTSFNNGSL
jgi:hypothetical protein